MFVPEQVTYDFVYDVNTGHVMSTSMRVLAHYPTLTLAALAYPGAVFAVLNAKNITFTS